jgi:hypothetical protein
MSQQPIVSFYSSSLLGMKPFPPDHLHSLVPLSQTDFSGAIKSHCTYQQYFQVIQKILIKNSYRLLLKAVQRQLALPIRLLDVQSLNIYSEKHGNWYHPSKIEVITLQGSARFVLNVALTERGQAAMAQEVRALKYLSGHFSYPWLPTLYFYEESEAIPNLGNENEPLSMSLFLADWFEGFHEFHLSLDPVDETIKLVLWDGNLRPNYLSHQQANDVYSDISKILTLYYNPRTYDQIFPWHHGAGDFVVKLDADRIAVRLVTVRQYGPLADPEEISFDEALIFFFLNLSLRMRLDRLNGVGEIAWAGEECLASTWEGFREGLRIKEKEEGLPQGFRNSFLKKISWFSKEEITERFEDLLNSYNPKAPDLQVIKRNMVSHINQVLKAIQGLGR